MPKLRYKRECTRAKLEKAKRRKKDEEKCDGKTMQTTPLEGKSRSEPAEGEALRKKVSRSEPAEGEALCKKVSRSERAEGEVLRKKVSRSEPAE